LCKIRIKTPTQHFPRAPLPAIGPAKTPLAAMRSRRDQQRLGQSGSPALRIIHSSRLLFQNHVIAAGNFLRRLPAAG
jgi:hypothetical protein